MCIQRLVVVTPTSCLLTPMCHVRLPATSFSGVEATAELLGVSEYVETMQMRIRTLLSDSRMKIVSGTAQNCSR